MNKNNIVRNKKEKSIKHAIQYLYETGHTNPTKKVIAKTIRELFPNDLESQINTNTLSKVSYYKENIGNWISEITGVKAKHLEIAREKAILSRKRSAQKNFKEIEKQAFKIVDLILTNKLSCEKFTKKFLTHQLMKRNTQKMFKINHSTFSQEFYLPIYKNALTRLHNDNNHFNNKNHEISTSQLMSLKIENKRLKDVNAKLIKGLFTINNREGEGFVSNEENHFKDKITNINLDKELVYSYMMLFKKRMDEEINAIDLFKEIVEFCKKD